MNMKNPFQTLLLIILVVLSSCSDDDNQSQIIDMRINHYQGTGIAVAPVLTYLIQKGKAIGTDNWENFYSTIEGFNYEPGYIYNLAVSVEHIDNPPADGSSYSYKLQRIVSKEEVDKETHFNIHLKINGQSFLTGNTASDYKILNQIEIDCSDLCTELGQSIQNQEFLTGAFKRIDHNKIQLIELK